MSQLFLLLLLTFVIQFHAKIKESTFADVDSSTKDLLVVFYYKSDAGSKKVLNLINKIQKKIKKETKNFYFRKCDGDKDANKDSFADAGFEFGNTYIFTSTEEEGILEYTGEVEESILLRHVQFKTMSYDEMDVINYHDEDDFWDLMDRMEDPKPLFTFFYTQDCEDCEILNRGFNTAATYFRDRIQFVRIDCTAGHLEFCKRQNVEVYPKIILFTGETKMLWEDETHDLTTYENFFDMHVPVKNKKKKADIEDKIPKTEIKDKKEKAEIKNKKAKVEIKDKIELTKETQTVNHKKTNKLLDESCSVEIIEKLTRMEKEIKELKSLILDKLSK